MPTKLLENVKAYGGLKKGKGRWNGIGSGNETDVAAEVQEEVESEGAGL